MMIYVQFYIYVNVKNLVKSSVITVYLSTYINYISRVIQNLIFVCSYFGSVSRSGINIGSGGFQRKTREIIIIKHHSILLLYYILDGGIVKFHMLCHNERYP